MGSKWLNLATSEPLNCSLTTNFWCLGLSEDLFGNFFLIGPLFLLQSWKLETPLLIISLLLHTALSSFSALCSLKLFARFARVFFSVLLVGLERMKRWTYKSSQLHWKRSSAVSLFNDTFYVYKEHWSFFVANIFSSLSCLNFMYGDFIYKI